MAKQYGMVIDTTRCMGCQTCVVSCKISNQVPGDVYWSRVVSNNSDAFDRPAGVFPDVKLSYRPELCNHCSNPACVAACPTGAMHKREEDGVVLVDDEVCIGCGTCVSTCPYQMPKLDEEKGVSTKCTMCYDRLNAGLEPWCVQACPAEARIVGDLNDPESEVALYIAEKGAVPLFEEYGTEPNVYVVGLSQDATA